MVIHQVVCNIRKASKSCSPILAVVCYVVVPIITYDWLHLPSFARHRGAWVPTCQNKPTERRHDAHQRASIACVAS